MERGDGITEVADVAVGARVLKDGTEDLSRVQIVGLAGNHFDAQWRCARAHHINILGVAVHIHKECGPTRFGDTLCHGHGLGRCRGLIQ